MTDEYRIHFETVSRTQKSLIRAKGNSIVVHLSCPDIIIILFEHHRPCSRRANTPSLHYEITYKQPLQDVMKM